jgi:hypothetical protein
MKTNLLFSAANYPTMMISIDLQKWNFLSFEDFECLVSFRYYSYGSFSLILMVIIFHTSTKMKESAAALTISISNSLSLIIKIPESY